MAKKYVGKALNEDQIRKAGKAIGVDAIGDNDTEADGPLIPVKKKFTGSSKRQDNINGAMAERQKKNKAANDVRKQKESASQAKKRRAAAIDKANKPFNPRASYETDAPNPAQQRRAEKNREDQYRDL